MGAANQKGGWLLWALFREGPNLAGRLVSRRLHKTGEIMKENEQENTSGVQNITWQLDQLAVLIDTSEVKLTLEDLDIQEGKITKFPDVLVQEIEKKAGLTKNVIEEANDCWVA